MKAENGNAGIHEIIRTAGLEELICGAGFLDGEAAVEGCAVKQAINTRSAGFYALGRAQTSRSKIGVAVRDEHLQLLSPVAEAFYQNTKLYILLFVEDLAGANRLYNAFRTVAAEIVINGSLEEIRGRRPAGPVVLIVPHRREQPEEKREIRPLDMERTCFHESVFRCNAETRGINLGRGYGVLSQYIGHGFAGRGKSVLYITYESFLKDMNALWIRNASGIDGIIVVVGGCFTEIRAWGMTLHIPVFRMTEFCQEEHDKSNGLVLLWEE